MENKKLVVKGNDMEVIEGKVVISSEDLAAAIQTQQVNLEAEEEAEGSLVFQIGCNTGC